MPTNPNSLTPTRIPNAFALVSDKTGITNVITKNGPFIIGIKSDYQYDLEIFRSCLTPGDDGSQNENTTAPSRNTSYSSMTASFILEHEFWSDNMVVYRTDEFQPDINNCSISVVNKNNMLDYAISLGSTASNLEEACLYLYSKSEILCLNCNYPSVILERYTVLLIDFGYFLSYPMYGNKVYNILINPDIKDLNVVNGSYQGYGPGTKIYGGSIIFNSGFIWCEHDVSINSDSFTIDILLSLSNISLDTIIVFNTNGSEGYIITGKQIIIYNGRTSASYDHGLYVSSSINGYCNIVSKYDSDSKNLIFLINNNVVINVGHAAYAPNSTNNFYVGGNGVISENLTIVSIKMYDTFLTENETTYNYNNMLHRYQYL